MRETKLPLLMEDAGVLYKSSKKEFNAASVRSISTDTRSLKRGDLFVALKGDTYDGHSFIEGALKSGAFAVIFESGRLNGLNFLNNRFPEKLFIGVRDTRKALGKIAENYIEGFSVNKIAVTGSAGKTTTKELITAVLASRFNVVSSAGSFNNDIGVPKTVLNVDEDTDFLVQEFGTNHPGEILYLSRIVRQNFALITNIGPAHIGFFKSEEDIAGEKKQALEVVDRKGAVFLNAEDKFFGFLKKGIKANVRSFGLRGGDLFPERILKTGLYGSEFVLKGERIRTAAVGEHGVLNAVASALVGSFFGLTVDEIKSGIESFSGSTGRGRVYKAGGFTVVDESYNANPLSVSVSIKFIDSVPSSGNKILVLGDMLELGEKSGYYHRIIADRIAESGIKKVYAYGREVVATVIACKRAGFEDISHFTDIGELVADLKKEAREGDLIMVKGSRAMKLDRVVNELTGN